ncbi:alpha/beta fold hydrolase, partial [Burkholderia sp. Ac-20353]|uniref:alpha/beta fold hydrolase n=1 Tax=Burkholderia sp. Ac-20353 TaxID=2703894 RepID=UPI00197BC73A
MTPAPIRSAPPVRRRLHRDAQSIAFAVAGDPRGHPVVVLHGGPGSGSQAGILRLFDLTRTCVVLVDQRGAGASSPRGGTRHNNTAQLINDLEAVREQLGIARWGVVGGSWGAALALAYAGAHPGRVTGVVLRGLFLTSAREVRRLFTTSRTRAPRAWQHLCRAARCSQPDRLLSCCARRLRPGA